MNGLYRNLLSALLLGSLLAVGGAHPSAMPLVAAEGPAVSSPVFAGGEKLRYRLLWPSGINLGEADLSVVPGDKDLSFELTVDADLPVHDVHYSFAAKATREGLCSSRFEGKSTEGTKKVEESVEFDQVAHQARRTRGGQTSSLRIPECARDPLTFFYYFRSQLAAGAPVSPATFYAGSGYSLEIKLAAPETISPGGRQQRAEKYVVIYRGPNSARTIELWVSADSRRAPVLVRMPFPLATFSAELQ